jgi:hypothetical protein
MTSLRIAVTAAMVGVILGLAHRYTQPVAVCRRCGTTCRHCHGATPSSTGTEA